MSAESATGATGASGRDSGLPKPLAKRFHDALTVRWDDAGRPSRWDMARNAKVEPDKFPVLSTSIHMMPWADVEMFLHGCGEKASEMGFWQDYWERANHAPAVPARHLKAVRNTPPARRTRPAPREDRPLSAAAVDVQGASTVQEFVHCLEELRISAGLSYLDIGAANVKGMSRSTAHAMLSATAKLPRRKQVETFVRVCGASQAEIDIWVEAWSVLAELRLNKRAPVPSPRADTDAGIGIEAAATRASAPIAFHASAPPQSLGSPSSGTTRSAPPAGGGGASWQPAAPQASADERPRPHAAATHVVAHQNGPASIPVRVLLPSTLLLVLVCGTGVAMWSAGIPTEVIGWVYFCTVMLAGTWLIYEKVPRQNEPDTRSRYAPAYLVETEDVFGNDTMVAPTTIGA